MGGLWGWPKTHRGFEPSVYFHSDEIFPCGFKGIGAEYLMNCVTLSFPHICLSLAAAMLGSSLAFAWYECFLPACASTSWYFWVSAELPWSCLSGLMQGGFVFLGFFWEFFWFFGLCCSLSFSLSSPRLSCVEECWLLGFPVLSLVLFTSEGKKMQSLGLTQSWRCFFFHDNSKLSLIFNVLICISNCYCKCCLHSVQL